MAGKRELAESCFEFLYLELVRTFYVKEEDDRGTRASLDAMGFQVGQQLAERYTLERARFSDHLEVIKFICKEFWNELFKKQVDNLKTNRNREIFVLQDNRFRWLRHMSLPDDVTEAAEKVHQYLVYPCGIIKGALASFGVICEVSAELTDSATHACAFHIRITQK